MIDNYQFNKESFFVIDKGRSKEECAVVKINDGKYCGFGFVNAMEEINSAEQLDPAIKYFPDNRDVRHILRNHLASGKPRNNPVLKLKKSPSFLTGILFLQKFYFLTHVYSVNVCSDSYCCNIIADS